MDLFRIAISDIGQESRLTDGAELHLGSRIHPLAALWSAFPELRNELDESDAEPYYIYDRFADYLVSHRDDNELWQRAYAFFDSLATDGNLQEILVVGLFEPLCVDPVLADRVRTNVSPIALKLLRNMKS